MNCQKVKNKLAAFCDDQISPKEKLAIKNHLAQCADCTSLYYDMADYKRAITSVMNQGSESETSPFISDLQQKIISSVDELRQNQTVWDKFWESKYGIYMSYSTAAAAMILIVFSVFNLFIITDNDLDSNNLSNTIQNISHENTMSQGNNNHYVNVTDGYSSGVVASPIQTSEVPLSYTFVMDNNKMISAYQSGGEIIEREQSVDINRLNEVFGNIAIQLGKYELAACPENAREFFNSVLSNEFLNGSPLQEEARRNLSRCQE